MRWLSLGLVCVVLLLQGCVGKLPTHPEWTTQLEQENAPEGGSLPG